MQALTKQELHNLAMNHVGEELEKRGFEFIAINSTLKKHPQFVCGDKDNQKYFVIVRVVILPKNPDHYDVIWMEKFKLHAMQNNAKIFYAGIGLANAENEELPLYENEPYLMQYEGIQVIETNLN